MGFCVFFVHDTAATRGVYLALSKAWRFCDIFCLCFCLFSYCNFCALLCLRFF